jgi:hypothetical protein
MAPREGLGLDCPAMSDPETARAAPPWNSLRGPFLALLAIVALGLVHLPYPFFWDQSMFALGARRLAAGGVLYRDFWDIKQPGIYWFYEIAGRCFGFTETGVHGFELLWMAAFALVLLATLRRRWGAGPAATLAPLFVVGAYYAGARDVYLTQVEGLVGFPLYLALWFATDGPGEAPRAWRGFASGLAGAVVALFKLAFLPLVGTFWLLALVAAWRRHGAARAATAVVLPVALGLLVPLAAVATWYVHLGLGRTLLWTTFTYPAFLLRHAGGGQMARVLEGGQRFLLRFAPVAGLATAGLVATWRRRDALGVGFAAWLLVGTLLILVQRWSGWPYHQLLLLPPLGLLAAAAIAALAPLLGPPGAEARTARRLAAVGLACLFIGLVGFAGRKGVELARHRFALAPADRVAYQRDASPLYAQIGDDLARLSAPGRPAGPIYSLEQPLVYFLARRPAAAAFRGAEFPEWLDAPGWAALAARLAADPPVHVLVERRYAALVTGPSPRAGALAALLAARYRVAFTSRRGTWYERVP